MRCSTEWKFCASCVIKYFPGVWMPLPTHPKVVVGSAFEIFGVVVFVPGGGRVIGGVCSFPSGSRGVGGSVTPRVRHWLGVGAEMVKTEQSSSLMKLRTGWIKGVKIRKAAIRFSDHNCLSRVRVGSSSSIGG